MKIAILSPSFLPHVGGAEFVAHNLGQAWGQLGHEVQIVNWVSDEVSHPEATYTTARFNLLRGAPRVGYHRLPFLQYTVRQLNEIFNRFNPDFIAGHMGYPTGPYLARVRPRRPYILTCHGRDLTHFDWGYRNEYKIDAVMRQAMEQSQGVIAISSYAHRMLEELGVTPEKIHDIPNGVDLSRFRRSVKFDLRDELGIPPETPIILSVGREHPQKAFASGIRAFATLAQKSTDAHYVILGKGTDAHAPLIQSLGLTDRIHVHPGLQGDALVGAYQAATVFFSSSIWEMMPLVVLESMATGIPAVVTNISGSQDLVLDGQTGYVVEAGDEEAMANRLLELLNDESLRNQFGR
ncbi:glycosyltransferase family 4 protein, partial [Myxococcota bacterium]|nr:glycosyltransferase family 4 protein [Myxococcota bacterium]